MNEWRELTLRCVGQIVTGKTPPTSDTASYGGEIPFVTPSDMDGSRTIEKTARTLTEQGASKVRSSFIRQPSVVVSCIGSDMGKAALVNEPYVSNQQINSITTSAEFDRLFVYYNLSARKDEIRNKASGAAQPIMNKTDFGGLPINVPSLEIQRAIGNVLGALDDKIELNRRMNETLEVLAQAIFKDWFVTFGPTRRKMDGATDPVAVLGGLIPDPAKAAPLAALFPDSFGEDGLPEGWQSHKLKGLASLSKVSTSPSKTPDQLFEHHSLPAYDKGEEPVIEQGSAILSNKFVVPENAVLLSKLNPEISRVWVPNRGERYPQIASTEFLVLVPTEGVGRSLLCAICRDPTFRSGLEGMVTGTSKSHQRISPPVLIDKEIVHGAFDAFKGFDALAAPLLDKRLALRAESRTLAETRDYLLPKLMSGAVRVRDAEKVVS